MPKKRGKKYTEAAKKVEAALAANGDGGLAPEEACKIVKATSTSKFDATVEAHIRLGVDPRHAEQMVRGAVVLTNGTGNKGRVAVFAVGDRAREAQEAGADVVGGDDLVQRVADGGTDFDAPLATPERKPPSFTSRARLSGRVRPGHSRQARPAAPTPNRGCAMA